MTDTKWISRPVDQKDDYLNIEEPGTWTVEVLVGLYNRTNGRFSYRLHPSGKTAHIRYKNYTLGYSDSKIKVESKTGIAIMIDDVDKEVVIS